MSEATTNAPSEARSAFRDPVIRQADDQARLYLYGEEHGLRITREQKEVIESIVATDYDGRTVIELLQNGHDAHPRGHGDGALEVILHEDEGAHGVLYVANAGCPVDHDDFEAICSLGLSTKRPDEGIGNKGVGFKSVLQLADSPEIYSASKKGAGRFDGYCLRFARATDFDDVAARVAPHHPGLADALRENVAALKVPVPLDDVPTRVAEWAARGFETVVRLALRSDQACGRARQQMLELEASDVPFHLFLDRVATITLRRATAGGETTVALTRRRVAEVEGGGLLGEHLELQDGSRFLLVRRSVPEAAMQRAIADSRIEGQLSSGWERWEGDAQVAVALPLDAPLEVGRLYTFLPMGAMAPAPFAGFVNAPFFARLDRRSLDETVPLNDLLLSEVGRLCSDAVLGALAGEVEIGSRQLLDLVTWAPSELPRLTAALASREARLEELPILPVVGDTHARVSLEVATLWLSEGRSFTPAAVAAAGVDGLIDPSLDSPRRERLNLLAEHLDVRLTPTEEQIAHFAEAYAEELATSSFVGEAWAEFFDDLALSLKGGAVLSGKNILIDGRAELLAAGDGADGPVVFVARREDDSEAPAVSPPQSVASRLAFTHPAIPRRTEPGGPLRPGWRWLEQWNLVQEYRTESVLTLVGQTMQSTDPADEELLTACLRFAFDVWRGATREVGAAALAKAGLLVPTAAGWTPPPRAVFGPGWGGPSAAVDDLLSRFLQRVDGAAPSLASVSEGLVREADTVLQVADDLEQRRAFLEALGVRHGLWPRHFPSSGFRMKGERLGNPRGFYDFDIDIDAAGQAVWREVAATWPRQPPSFSTTQYAPRTDVAALPGQQDWVSLDIEARRMYAELVLWGLDVWPDSDIEFHFEARTDDVEVAWPSFVSSFLATAEWIPQTTPGDRATVTLESASSAWWLQEEETPDYVRAQPAALRKLASSTVLDRLQKVGVRFWDEPASATDRLEELARVAEGTSRVPIRKAYEDAWRDLDAIDGTCPLRIVASRHGRLCVVDLAEDGEPVYVGLEEGIAKERLLTQAPVLMLAIRDRVLAARAHQRLEAAGATRLRPTVTADVVVTADGVPAERAPSRPLSEIGGHWFPMLVLGVLEYGDSGFRRVSAAHLRKAERLLAEAMISVAQEVVTTVDGHVVHEAHRCGSFLLEDSKIVVEVREHADPWEVLATGASAVAELVERPALEPQIRLGVIDLKTRGEDSPGLRDVAAILGVHPDDVAGLLDSKTDASDVIAVLACISVPLAEELQDAAAHLDGRDALREWLSERLVPPMPEATAVLELAGRGDPLAVILELGVDLPAANAGLRAVGLAPVHNAHGHARAMEAYVQSHRSALHDRLRNRFASAPLDESHLDDYIRLRGFPDLAADPAWLDVYWDVPEHAIEAQVAAWLDAVAPRGDEPEQDLPPVDELREAGRRTLSSVIANVRVLVDAWLHRHAAGVGNRPAEVHAITEAITTSGRMDFSRLTAAEVVQWLHRHDQWPEGMPLVTSRAELGLSEADLRSARERLERDREQRRRQTTYVEYDGRTFTEDTEDLVALADALREELRSNPVSVPVEPCALADIEMVAGGQRGPRGPSRRGRASTPSPERTSAIGLAGEVVVGEWLRQQYGVPPEDSWQSGYRFEMLGDGVGSDGLGYDFRIVTGTRTLLIEVKASIGDACEFTLGESEVRRAQSLAADEEYMVVFVPHVLDAALRRVVPLPNPFGHGGLRRYRIAGRALRLEFELASEA